MMTFIHPNVRSIIDFHQSVISSQSETIFSESPRYNAEPGAHTTIQTTEVIFPSLFLLSMIFLSQSRFVRLGGRYGKCVKSIDEVKSYYYDGSYTTDVRNMSKFRSDTLIFRVVFVRVIKMRCSRRVHVWIRDIRRTPMQKHANYPIVRPLLFIVFITLLRETDHFWC